MSDYPIRFGEFLAEEIKKRGFARKTLSEKTGIDLSSLSLWITGARKKPKKENVIKLAKALYDGEPEISKIVDLFLEVAGYLKRKDSSNQESSEYEISLRRKMILKKLYRGIFRPGAQIRLDYCDEVDTEWKNELSEETIEEIWQVANKYDSNWINVPHRSSRLGLYKYIGKSIPDMELEPESLILTIREKESEGKILLYEYFQERADKVYTIAQISHITYGLKKDFRVYPPNNPPVDFPDINKIRSHGIIKKIFKRKLTSTPVGQRYLYLQHGFYMRCGLAPWQDTLLLTSAGLEIFKEVGIDIDFRGSSWHTMASRLQNNELDFMIHNFYSVVDQIQTKDDLKKLPNDPKRLVFIFPLYRLVDLAILLPNNAFVALGDKQNRLNKTMRDSQKYEWFTERLKLLEPLMLEKLLTNRQPQIRTYQNTDLHVFAEFLQEYLSWLKKEDRYYCIEGLHSSDYELINFIKSGGEAAAFCGGVIQEITLRKKKKDYRRLIGGSDFQMLYPNREFGNIDGIITTYEYYEKYQDWIWKIVFVWQHIIYRLGEYLKNYKKEPRFAAHINKLINFIQRNSFGELNAKDLISIFSTTHEEFLEKYQEFDSTEYFPKEIFYCSTDEALNINAPFSSLDQIKWRFSHLRDVARFVGRRKNIPDLEQWIIDNADKFILYLDEKNRLKAKEFLGKGLPYNYSEQASEKDGSIGKLYSSYKQLKYWQLNPIAS